MTGWLRRPLRALAHAFKWLLGRLLDRLLLGRRHEERPPEIVGYRGHGNAERVWLGGRLLDGRILPLPRVEGAGAWQNLRNMYRRFRCEPIPGVRIGARLGDAAAEAVTDEDGFFWIALPRPAGGPDAPGPLEAELRLLDPPPEKPAPKAATVRIDVPSAAARAFVSDLDDTVLYTYATEKLRMLRLLLFRAAHQRLPFPGVAAFYDALRSGPTERDVTNPFFYVSSSAWNIYDLLRDFLDLNGLPRGPILLRPFRLSFGSLFRKGRHDHKLDRIEELLAAYPELPFVLIGDSGQRDPELYAHVARRHPERVDAIYLRDVRPTAARHAEVEAIRAELAGRDVHVLLVPDSLAAARDAAERGWLEPRRLAAVEAECARVVVDAAGG